jgi:hypothetical protein
MTPSPPQQQQQQLVAVAGSSAPMSPDLPTMIKASLWLLLLALYGCCVLPFADAINPGWYMSLQRRHCN